MNSGRTSYIVAAMIMVHKNIKRPVVSRSNDLPNNQSLTAEAETLIIPCCIDIVKKLFGKVAAEEVKKIHLSNNTVRRRIIDISADIEKSVMSSLRRTKLFTLQVDESTDISGKAQLLAYIRFVHKGETILE